MVILQLGWTSVSRIISSSTPLHTSLSLMSAIPELTGLSYRACSLRVVPPLSQASLHSAQAEAKCASMLQVNICHKTSCLQPCGSPGMIFGLAALRQHLSHCSPSSRLPTTDTSSTQSAQNNMPLNFTFIKQRNFGKMCH